MPRSPIAAARVMASVVDRAFSIFSQILTRTDRCSYTVTPSLSSHFATIYALAILFPSLVILLAGSFLTLDRTRSVDTTAGSYEKSLPVIVSQYGPSKEKSKFNSWQFRGGLGGMLSGFLLGRALSCRLSNEEGVS